MTTVAFTGHRCDKLPNKETGYKLPNPTYNYICQELEKHLLQIKPEKCISGMALGFDSYAANVCVNLNIPFIAAVPFEGQEKLWPEKSQKQYQWLLSKASEIFIISPGTYAAYKMQVRNVWMIDRSDIVISCFDGSPGGTKNAISYTSSKNKQIINIDPRKATNA